MSSVRSVAKLFREAASIFGMIVLFTDFGLADPYVGQMHGVLAREAPGVPVIDLFHAVPNYDIRAAAYLLPAFVPEFPPESVFVPSAAEISSPLEASESFTSTWRTCWVAPAFSFSIHGLLLVLLRRPRVPAAGPRPR